MPYQTVGTDAVTSGNFDLTRDYTSIPTELNILH